MLGRTDLFRVWTTVTAAVAAVLLATVVAVGTATAAFQKSTGTIAFTSP